MRMLGRLHSLPWGPLHRATQDMVAIFPPKERSGRRRDNTRGDSVIYTLIPAVTGHHVHCMSLLTGTHPGTMWEGTIPGCEYKEAGTFRAFSEAAFPRRVQRIRRSTGGGIQIIPMCLCGGQLTSLSLSVHLEKMRVTELPGISMSVKAHEQSEGSMIGIVVSNSCGTHSGGCYSGEPQARPTCKSLPGRVSDRQHPMSDYKVPQSTAWAGLL